MQITRNDNKPRATRTAALAALLAIATQAFAALDVRPAPAPAPAPRASAPRPPQDRPPRGSEPAIAPMPPEPADVPGVPEPAEAPEPPEPPDYDFDFDIDIDWDNPQVANAMRDASRAMRRAGADMRGRRFELLGFQDFSSEIARTKDPVFKTYLEGRQLLSESEWEKGLGKFNEVITQHKDSKHVDGSLFWSAYALKKMSRYPEAWKATERIVNEYPKSRWIDETQQLREEIAGPAGQPIPPEVKARQEEELKIAVLQGLMQNGNQQRAVEVAGGILKPGSTASPRLKQHAVILLSQIEGSAATDLLIQTLERETDPKVKKQIIIALGQRIDDAASGARIFEVLKRIALSGDPESAKMAVVALGQNDDPRVLPFLIELARNAQSVEIRKHAIVMLGQRDDPAACDALASLYRNEKDPELQRHVLVMIAQNDCEKAIETLTEVARNGATAEVRRFALIMLAQRDEERALGVLVQMYDAAKDEATKESVITGLGQMVDRKPALLKLMQIAKNESSPELRKRAIIYIGQSEDPEAIQFLIDLLK
jgi:HEAT repeat protein